MALDQELPVAGGVLGVCHDSEGVGVVLDVPVGDKIQQLWDVPTEKG